MGSSVGSDTFSLQNGILRLQDHPVLTFTACCFSFRSAVFEHTVVITDKGAEILTLLAKET